MQKFLIILVLSAMYGCASENVIDNQQNQGATSQNEPQKAETYKDFKNAFEQNPESFSIDAQKDVTIKTKNGSRIHISKNSFVGADGKKVKGKISFDVMEFNTRGEIIASNIPMVYKNPQGETEQFESAGMFSLAASKDGLEISLDKGKKIKVEYATDVDGAFNFYELNEDSTNWKLKASNLLPQENPYLEKIKEKLDLERLAQPEQPKKPLASAQGDELFDLMAFEHSANFNADFNGLMWKYIGNNPELNPARAPGKFGSFHRLKGIEPYDTNFLAFTMDFHNTSTKKDFSLNAAPVYRGALLNRQEKKYEETIKRIEQSAQKQNAMLKEIENEKELLRTFEVENLGIFNYDVKNFDANNMEFAANFTFEGLKQDQVNVYLLPTEARIVVKFIPATFKDFSINPKKTNKLVAILPNKDIYALGNRDIKKLDLFNEEPGSTVTFDLKKFKKPVDTPEELDKVIDLIL